MEPIMIIMIQGDLLITKIDKIPSGAKKRENNILVWGEATGHAHRITAGSVYDHDDRILFTVPTGATIIHEDHGETPIEEGDYGVIRQRQKTGKDMTALVID